MENGQDFIDYYDLLQVNPGCDARILEVAYRYFAKMYHPDHAETADVDKFNEVVQAYHLLRDAEKRAEYDQIYFSHRDRSEQANFVDIDFEVDEKAAVTDAEIHQKILLHLYKRRREAANDAGVIAWLLQELLECSEEHFEFHVWYLRAKGLIARTEQGTLEITIEGVDHVISTSRSHSEKILQIAKPLSEQG